MLWVFDRLIVWCFWLLIFGKNLGDDLEMGIFEFVSVECYFWGCFEVEFVCECSVDRLKLGVILGGYKLCA